MGREQFVLPGEFQNIPTIPTEGPYPQPRLERPIRYPTFDALYTHDYDLNFRGRVNALLIALQERYQFNLAEILPHRTDVPMFEKDESDVYLPLVRYYLFPQHQVKSLKWLDQEEVISYLQGQIAASRVRGALLRALLRIEHRTIFGSESIATLLPQNPLFRLLLKKQAHTIPEVLKLKEVAPKAAERQRARIVKAREEMLQRGNPEDRELAERYLPPDLIQRLLIGSFIETQSWADELNHLMKARGYALDLAPLFPEQLPPTLVDRIIPHVWDKQEE